MTMQGIRLKWKQTTSNKKQCYLCKKSLVGVEGYAELRWGNSSSWSYVFYNFCLDCFAVSLGDFEKQKGTPYSRKKKYKILIKKRILRNLK